jgi:hypothetical protein
MEVEGPEDKVVFLERAVDKDGTPGVVPDGKSVCDDGCTLLVKKL